MTEHSKELDIQDYLLHEPPFDEYKRKVAALAKKYNISHKRDIDWHNFVAEVEQLFHPELKESEDERIRKRICLCLDECVHSDIIRDYERDEVLAYLEKQKEQKSVQSDVEKEYVRIIKSLIFDFIRDRKPKDPMLYQGILNWLEGRHVEQKPAEWSEEDENTIQEIIGCIEQARADSHLSEDHCLWLETFLYKHYRPSWKPSEEQTEVDLEQEVISYFQGMWPGIDSNMPMKFMPPAIMRLVKHFYELGKEQKPKVMQEVSDNVDKLRAISTPAEEDWFKVAEEWEKEDKKDAMTEQGFRIIDDGIWISRSELEKMRRKYFGSALEAMDVKKEDTYRHAYFAGQNNLCLELLIRINGCKRPLTE